MKRSLVELSKKYVGTKFVSIISTDCIAKYPDQLLPTLILYKDGKVNTTIETLAKFGGKRVTPESKSMRSMKSNEMNQVKCYLSGDLSLCLFLATETETRDRKGFFFFLLLLFFFNF